MIVPQVGLPDLVAFEKTCGTVFAPGHRPAGWRARPNRLEETCGTVLLQGVVPQVGLPDLAAIQKTCGTVSRTD